MAIESNVFKEDVSLAKAQSTLVSQEDRGYTQCNDPFLVVADLTNIARHRNDVSSAWDFGDAISFVLKKDGVVTTYTPTDVVFPNQSDARYTTIEWRDVLDSDGVGCYVLEMTSTIAGIVQDTIIWAAYNLLPYQIDDYYTAKGTSRILSEFNDANDSLGINFTGALVLDSLRIEGKFGYFEPNTEMDNIEYRDGNMKKIRREDFDSYELRINLNGFCHVEKLRFHVLSENNCWMSDHNYDGYSYDYFDVPVIVKEGFVPDHKDGTRQLTGVVKFEDKVRRNQTHFGTNTFKLADTAPPGAPSLILPPAPNMYAFMFNGIDKKIGYGNNLDLLPTTVFTISWWFKCSNDNFDFLGKTDGSKGWWCNLTASGRVDFFIKGANGALMGQASSVSGLNNSVYHLITVSNTGSGSHTGMILYLDGVDVSIAAATGSPDSSANAADFEIGKGLDPSFYDGLIDDFRLFGVVKTPSEIATLYSDKVGLLIGGETNRLKMGDGDTFGGGNWTSNDSVGSLVGTSVNMVELDRVTDIPT